VHTANYSIYLPNSSYSIKRWSVLFKNYFPWWLSNFKAKISFLSPIYHLNAKFFTVKDKPLAYIYWNTLNDWNPGDSVKKILPELFALLHKKNPDSLYDYNDNSRRNEFVNNRALFDKKAQYFTKKIFNGFY